MTAPAPDLRPPAPAARHLRTAAIGVALLVLYALGIGLRRHVVEQQMPDRGRPLPFTLESALQFRAIRSIYTGQGLAAVDREIQIPGGVRTFAHDTVGAEYLVAALCHLFPAEITLTDRVRWISVAWFSLGVPLAALWIRRRTGSWEGGLFAGFFYAVSVAAVIRSTGHEISHENFALPFLIAHLALAAGPPGAGHRRTARLAGSALCLAAALATWDLIQYYVLLWSLSAAWRWFRTPWPATAPDAAPLWVRVAGVLTACVASPYLRAHAAVVSPALAPLWALAVGVVAYGRAGRRGSRGAGAAAYAICMAIVIAAGSTVCADAYGHFGSLLAAKIRFLNRKPADPALLTFDQRILWTPALHSASWRLFRFLFPYTGPLTALATVVWFLRQRKEEAASIPNPEPLLFCHWASVAVFFFFVRFCVFAALFAAAALGAWAAWAVRRRGWTRWASVVALSVGGLAESGFVVHEAESLGSVPVLYPQLEEMGAWLKLNVAPEPVVANFQTSGFVLAYGRCPVVLHPKFESPEIRRRVRDYATHLFRGTERGLRAWAEGFGARYLVYSMGEFSNQAPELSLRYMVDARVPPEDAPARGFEYGPGRMECFHLLWQNAKYRVFRIITAAEEEAAARLVEAARADFEAGRLDEAERRAAAAHTVNPCDRRALEIVGKAASLRAQGFGQPPGAP
jgi:hypothetical protein